MGLIDRFQQYADAFEVFYEKNDTSVLEPFFTEDAVYETIADPPMGDLQEGRTKIFEGLIRSVDSFDRRFDSRELLMIEGPEERGDAVWLRWRVTYTKAGAPPFSIDGEETAVFEGDRIKRLEDRFAPNAAKDMMAWMQEHGSKLGDG
jgi:hypothetical protein